MNPPAYRRRSNPNNRGRGRPPKPHPNEVLNGALTRLDERKTAWRAVNSMLGLNQLPGTASAHQVTGAEEALHTLAVVVEDLLSQWFIQAVRQNGRPALQQIRRSAQDAARAEAIKSVRDAGLDPFKYKVDVTVSVGGTGARLGAGDVEQVMNRSSRNLAFIDKESWDQSAGTRLADPFRARAHTLTLEDWLLFSYVRVLRNYVAHRSQSALTTLNRTVRDVRSSPHSDLVWQGHRVVKGQRGSHPGDLLLVERTAGVPIIEVVFDRTRTALEQLRVPKGT